MANLCAMAPLPVVPRPPLPEGPFLVVGLARSGRAAAIALAERGARVVAVDSANPSGLEGLRQVGVEIHLDATGLELLDQVNAVVKSPGVPREAEAVSAARERGMPVLGELELGWRLLPNQFVAVTGTNGKTTVTEWLGEVWRRAERPVAVAGNVGTPLASLPETLAADATVICECSSFQLEDSEAFAPEVSVFLNFSPDHLDRHGTLEDYLGAKLRIFASQPEGTVAVWDADEPALEAGELVSGAADQATYGAEACRGDGCKVWMADGALHTAEGKLLELDRLALAGEHNARNAMAVAAAALSAGIGREAVIAGLEGFAGVPHRLERVGLIGDVAYVNDSKATNVAAAVAALRSFPGGVRVILGGSLKGGSFDDLAPAVAERCSAAYLIGEATLALRESLRDTGVELLDCGTLAAAVETAAASAGPGETVLLAPACASFDSFRDYEDRGDSFRTLVGELGA